MEACPQVSAHDLIMMCGLESQALGYNNLQKISDNDPFRKKGGVRGAKKSRLKARVVDIRSTEEFRLGHLPNSKNIPENSAFQADGSLNPSLSLGTVPKGRVIVVVGGKKEKEPVVSNPHLSHVSQGSCNKSTIHYQLELYGAHTPRALCI